MYTDRALYEIDCTFRDLDDFGLGGRRINQWKPEK